MTATDMKEIEKALNTIMRYVLAGGAAVLAFGIARPSHFRFLCTDKEHTTVSVTLTVLFVLVSGATTYLLHRALVYPLVRHCLMSCVIKRKHIPNTTPQALERALTEKRVERRRSDSPIQQHFDRWAAEVHGLYCISLGSALPLFVPLLGDRSFSGYAIAIIAAAVLVFIAALRHQWTFLVSEIDAAEITRRPNTALEPTPTAP